MKFSTFFGHKRDAGMGLELEPILQNVKNWQGLLHKNDSFKAENGLNELEKASFVLTFTKSVGPIFQSAGPISQHAALE